MTRALLLLLAAPLVSGGCVQNELSLSIVQMQAVTEEGGCVVSATPGVGRSRGTLDLQVGSGGYIATPVVRNNMQSRIVGTGPERNTISVQGLNVTLLDVAGGPAPLPPAEQKFFAPSFGGQIAPQATAGFSAQILSLQAAQSLAGRVPAGGTYTLVAEVSPVGNVTTDEVVGAAAQFPLDLCIGCLLGTPPPCPLPKGTMPSGGGCLPGQDEAIDCCVSSGGGLLCGSLAPVAP